MIHANLSSFIDKNRHQNGPIKLEDSTWMKLMWN